MAKARGEEASARTATLDTLLTMHAAQLRRLHGKTQSLAADNKGGAANARSLGQVLEKAGKDDAAGQSGIIAEASERLDTTLSGTAELLAESADPKVLAESPGFGLRAWVAVMTHLVVPSSGSGAARCARRLPDDPGPPSRQGGPRYFAAP